MSSKKSFYIDLVFSGFGGQGILIAGNLLCYSALLDGREVTFFPSYGVEMRGGAANCYVVISDRQIGSPIPSHPEIGMIMSLPALKRFENVIRSGGYLVINSDIISPEEVEREDVNKIFINANSISKDVVGNDRLANMVMLGYIAKRFSVVKKDSLISAIKEVVSEKHKKMIPLNEKAILAGYNLKLT
ncbi:MAG: 2-oxoacid:acceptor oxidoreductase family protein [Proteobacteria bacterium]|nr:2-oxoacid:acceptor oxidoreductase family protein [Pseudomonadota bacterium]